MNCAALHCTAHTNSLTDEQCSSPLHLHSLQTQQGSQTPALFFPLCSRSNALNTKLFISSLITHRNMGDSRKDSPQNAVSTVMNKSHSKIFSQLQRIVARRIFSAHTHCTLHAMQWRQSQLCCSPWSRQLLYNVHTARLHSEVNLGGS